MTTNQAPDSTKPMGENEAWYRNLTRQNATDSTKPETAEREELISELREYYWYIPAAQKAAALLADGKAGKEIGAWTAVSRSGLMRGIREGKPSEEDLAIAAADGDTVRYFYTRSQQAAQVAQPLTDEQKRAMWHGAHGIHSSWGAYEWYAQGIEDGEAAHGIGMDQA